MNPSRKKIIFITAFAIIMMIGIFLRAWHFSDWLHFELDQSRDAKVIDLAVKEGPSNLPLLGPKAAGSFLRLGPAFYYFKYLSALMFGNTPSGIAVIILLFGILAVPVFYFFVRRYFDEKISLGLMCLFSVSLFLVMYSRFSWNPNPLPLFVLLAFFALLKAVDKNEKRKNIWFLAFAFALSISTQLHFLAFVAIPSISLVFLIIKRPKIKIRYWIGAFLIILALYAPAIINDIKTGGDNIGQFLSVAGKKSEKNTHNLAEKIIKNYAENSLGYFLLLSGRENEELPRFLASRSGLGVICDQGCQKNIYLGTLAAFLFSLGIILLLGNTYGARFKNSSPQKDFLILVSTWFTVTFGLYTLIAYDISPRFFLLISALPFIFLGFILEFLSKKFPKFSIVITLGIISSLAFLNLWSAKQRFWQLENAPHQSFEIGADKILKERTRVTLEQQYLIVNYIRSIYDQNKYPVYLNSEPFYRRSFLFHIDQLKIPRDDFRNATNSKKVYEKGNYFLIYPTLSNYDSDIQKYSASYEVKNKKEFGTLTLIEMYPKKEAINSIEQEFEKEKEPKSAPGVPARYKWEQIFSDTESEE